MDDIYKNPKQKKIFFFQFRFINKKIAKNRHYRRIITHNIFNSEQIQIQITQLLHNNNNNNNYRHHLLELPKWKIIFYIYI